MLIGCPFTDLFRWTDFNSAELSTNDRLLDTCLISLSFPSLSSSKTGLISIICFVSLRMIVVASFSETNIQNNKTKINLAKNKNQVIAYHSESTCGGQMWLVLDQSSISLWVVLLSIKLVGNLENYRYRFLIKQLFSIFKIKKILLKM